MSQPTGADAAIAALRGFFPGRPFPNESVTLYSAALAKFDDATVVRAVEALVSRPSPFIPTVGEIVEEIAETVLKDRGELSVQRAWETALDPEMHGKLTPMVLAAKRAVGGTSTISARQSSGEGWAVRRDFESAYAERRNEAKREIIEGRNLAQVEPRRHEIAAVQVGDAVDAAVEAEGRRSR